MSDQNDQAEQKPQRTVNKAASRTAGAATILTGATTLAGFVEGSQWADVALRGGVPLFLLLFFLWTFAKAVEIAAPYALQAFNLGVEFVRGVKINSDANAAILKRLDEQQTTRHEVMVAALGELTAAKRAETSAFDKLAAKVDQTNAIMRELVGHTHTPGPPGTKIQRKDPQP